MSTKLWLAGAGLIVLLAGCNTATHIKKDDAVNFKAYHTYAWSEPGRAGKKGHAGSDLSDQKIRDAVQHELAKSGMREDQSDPDLLLTWDLLVEKSSYHSSDPVYSRPFTRIYYNRFTRRYGTIYYPSQFMGYEQYERPVKEGTITITMTDSHTGRTVWQGWTTDEVNSNNLTNRELEAAVHSIFRKADFAKN